ncbi:hypothetical protein TNCT_622143, partial [Trichonephila clavata]
LPFGPDLPGNQGIVGPTDAQNNQQVGRRNARNKPQGNNPQGAGAAAQAGPTMPGGMNMPGMMNNQGMMVS